MIVQARVVIRLLLVTPERITLVNDRQLVVSQSILADLICQFSHTIIECEHSKERMISLVMLL